MLGQHYKHWQVREDEQSIGWLYFNKHNAGANTFDREVLEELNSVLTELTAQKLQGLVISSGKSSGFIAGADINEFAKIESIDEAKVFIEYGQAVFAKLASLPYPTVAIISGFCMGGGLEFALACRYRIAEDDSKTRLGLPEVMLGIQPGWGGSVRLPAMIGGIQAMEMIMSGRTVSAREAYKRKLVDEVLPQRHLQSAAIFYLKNVPAFRHTGFLQNLSNTVWARKIIGSYIKKKLANKVKQAHYPAPYAVLDNWMRYGADNQSAFDAEVASIANLVTNETAKNLIRIFFLQEKMKSLAKSIQRDIKHIHVIGAGVMGGDIAIWCALQGLHVTLQDPDIHAIAKVIQRADSLFKKKLKQPRLAQEALDRLVADQSGYGISKAEIIIEAIFENLQAKQTLFRDIEPRLKEGAILATNTSSIPLDDLNQVLAKPERLVGIHFFNPVSKMRLVEVVHGNVTSQEVQETAFAFVRKLDRIPLPVLSRPGFLVNRVLMPYLLESVELLNEGIPAPVIDKAAMDFGMPMGPVELADTVGLDVCLAVAETLTKHYGGYVPESLRVMVTNGDLGKKTGRGYYLYKQGKPIKEFVKSFENVDKISNRLILRMLNECMACLREKIVLDADFLDGGMVLGTGFAPFRGGPMRYIASIGPSVCHAQLIQLAEQYGDRFKPDAAWNDFKGN